MLSEKIFKYRRQPYIPMSQTDTKRRLTAIHESKKDTKMYFYKGGIL